MNCHLPYLLARSISTSLARRGICVCPRFVAFFSLLFRLFASLVHSKKSVPDPTICRACRFIAQLPSFMCMSSGLRLSDARCFAPRARLGRFISCLATPACCCNSSSPCVLVLVVVRPREGFKMHHVRHPKPVRANIIPTRQAMFAQSRRPATAAAAVQICLSVLTSEHQFSR